MKKYPKIYRLNSDKSKGVLDKGKLLIMEKFDGSNFRFRRKNDKILMGTRNTEFKENGKPLPSEEIGGQFDETSDYISKTVDVNKIKEIEEEYDSILIFFGESCNKNELEYYWDELPGFLGFDIWMVNKGKWMDYPNVFEVFERLNLDTIKVIDIVDVEEFDEDMDIPQSEYRDGKAEGVIIKNLENNKKTKIKSEEFKEVNRMPTNNKNKGLKNDTIEMVEKYCPDMRIKKHIDKLVNEQEKDLSMELMEDLPMNVVDDIFEEEYKEIVRSDKNINFKQFRKIIAKKCVKILKNEI
ncbi:MAG: RNA ligase family protein [archaeon]